MEEPIVKRAIESLARAGEEAGISVEDMIRILNAGVSVEALLDLIRRNARACSEKIGRSSGWVM
jgi:hypothetical protein